MKAVQWQAPHSMRVVEIEKPEPRAHEVLVRVESTGVCGSDLHYYAEGRIGDTILTAPLILGHEYAGIVEAVGGDADRDLLGKRVAVEPGVPCGECEWCRKGRYNVCREMKFPGGPGCDGAFCEYMCVPAVHCFPVPDSMGSAEAAMMEPLAVAIHAVELARLAPGETVAILGLGPIGLLTAQVARVSGAGRIYGADLHAYRIEAALGYGVEMAFMDDTGDTVEAIMGATQGRGVDVVFDCARSSDTPGIACHVARPGGRCVLTGISGAETDPIPVGVGRRKELTLTWCRRFRFNFPTAIAMASSGKVDVRSLVTHSFPLEQTQDAFELVWESGDGVLKASVDQ